MSKKNQKNQSQLRRATNSSAYDWFRNGSNVNGDNKSNQLNFKTIWRFVKIFIYLFLFACTATGCVQIMVITGESQVGKGVELYNSEDKISPHVTRFDLNTKQTSKSNKEIYELTASSRSVIVTDKDELDLLHKEINENQKLKMTSAYNGVNEAVMLLGNGFKVPLKEQKVATFQSRPIILSSAFLKVHKDKKEVKFNESNYLFKDLKVEDLKVDNKSFFKELNNLEITNPNGQKTKIQTDKLILSGDLTDKIREQFSLGFIKILLEKELKNNQTFGQWTINSLKSNDQELKIAASKNLNMLFSYGGIRLNNSSQFTFTKNFMPAIGTSGSTNYRPIASWGQAWTHLGPFYGTFVYPISYISNSILDSFGFLSGWETIFTMIIVVVMIRLLTFLLGFKSILQQTKMQELSAKRASIEAKYAPYKGNKQMENRQRQEVSQLYKKEGISPVGQLLNALLSMPFFLSVWRVTQATPKIKSTVWLGIDFSATSYQRLFSGEVIYLPIIFFAALFSLGQQLVPRLLANRRNRNQINVHQKLAMRKNNRIQNIMMIVFVFFALAFNAGLQVYWIISGSWMICQGFFTHYLFIRQKQQSKRKKLGL